MRLSLEGGMCIYIYYIQMSSQNTKLEMIDYFNGINILGITKVNDKYFNILEYLKKMKVY